MTELVYITDVLPIMIENALCLDIHFLRKGCTNVNVLRVYNILLSFRLARPPGMTLNQFERWLEVVIPIAATSEQTVFDITPTLRDGSYFNFDHPYDYAEIYANSPFELERVKRVMENILVTYYSRIEEDKLPPWDAMFYRMTESPFSSTSASTHLSNTPTVLPTRYGIPLVGPVTMNFDRFDTDYPNELSPSSRVKRMFGLNAQEDRETINKRLVETIEKANAGDFNEEIVILSYDIETYNVGKDKPNCYNEDEYIMCIGVGIFNMSSQTPVERYCILSKRFDGPPVSPRTNKPLTFKRNGNTTIVYNEYSDQSNDYTTYISTKDEKSLLQEFVKLIDRTHPRFITGFNIYGFDDEYVYARMKRYGLDVAYLQSYTCYEYDELVEDGKNRHIIPAFKKFSIKYDGMNHDNNASVLSPVVHTVDVYKLMLKEDAKRFTQHGRGNLDTMLEVYRVTNPFNGENLSKTGLKIYEMWRRWDANENIYSIALYCCQDAWITGTLLLKRSKLSDLTEMAIISNTSMSDSILRADSLRVANTLMRYSYMSGFTMQDEPFDKRKEVLDVGYDKTLGKKNLDNRVILGGAVRNVHAGKQIGVIAGDFSAMYPSQVEGNTISVSSKVDPDLLFNPSKYGMEVYIITINEVMGPRDVFYIKHI